jgi:hypothetical protein
LSVIHRVPDATEILGALCPHTNPPIPQTPGRPGSRPARPRRDRHDRRIRPTPTTGPPTGRRPPGRADRSGPDRTTGPRHTLGPPKVVPMTDAEQQAAVAAWAALIATWWHNHPPDTA